MTEKYEEQRGETFIPCFVSPSSSIHTWLNETKALEKHCHHYYYWGERGEFSHLPDTFNGHCNLGLSCPCTSMANEFMKPFTERSSTTCLCHVAARNEGSLLGLGPHLDYEWESRERAGSLRLAQIHIQAPLWADTCVQRHEKPDLM